MVTPGVADTGVYIPRYRLSAKELGQQWQRWMGKGERAVANHDEDALTMAVAAASRCMGDRDAADIDALFFASTTAFERSICSVVGAFWFSVPLYLAASSSVTVRASLSEGSSIVLSSATWIGSDRGCPPYCRHVRPPSFE